MFEQPHVRRPPRKGNAERAYLNCWILALGDSGLIGEVSRGEKMLHSGTDPESYITEYTLMLYSGTDPESYITEYTSEYEDNTPRYSVQGGLM